MTATTKTLAAKVLASGRARQITFSAGRFLCEPNGRGGVTFRFHYHTERTARRYSSEASAQKGLERLQLER